ncbi:hypothetical protein OU798_04770 [Prolixibacteraceae bacterium Z1-6]|uniref:Uncharacterized protein n=1 Tax=Draconibacterium aestuarii TaxID=2998507 RepID=A0A9X3J5N4_9BACT|nr:hypothetical protein [Prolixibacteraceae bacterium Z1-6]
MPTAELASPSTKNDHIHLCSYHNHLGSQLTRSVFQPAITSYLKFKGNMVIHANTQFDHRSIGVRNRYLVYLSQNPAYGFYQ